MALAKFYGVMTAALALKSDRWSITNDGPGVLRSEWSSKDCSVSAGARNIPPPSEIFPI